MKISFIQPSRNNLKYLVWSYESIRRNQGAHEVEICVADDFSNDGTWEWCQDRMKNDPNFKAIRNEGPTRLGHTLLYDKLINEVASNEVGIIYHADMYLCPGALDSIEKYIKPKTIVSLTRIEPPLHPPGPEKILMNFGSEPEDFKEDVFINWFNDFTKVHSSEVTEGVFAPWAFYLEDFKEIGGHDPLFAPQSKEDSDIFNRFYLNGIKFIQTWSGFVYHMTCRGSRYNPNLTVVGKESQEWLEQNNRSTKNFIRKWGHFVKHDKFMNPIVYPKYNIGIVLENANLDLIRLLEPWCSKIYVHDDTGKLISSYVNEEQKNTKFNLSSRVLNISESKPDNDIVLFINSKSFNQVDFNLLQEISDTISHSGQIGRFSLGNIILEINDMKEYTYDLICL